MFRICLPRTYLVFFVTFVTYNTLYVNNVISDKHYKSNKVSTREAFFKSDKTCKKHIGVRGMYFLTIFTFK